MRLLLKVFLDILLLRLGPQVLPASHLLLGMALGLHFALGVVFYSATLNPGSALVAAMFGSVMVPGLVLGALILRGLGHRFVQTASALVGAEVLLALIALPFSLFAPESGVAAVAALLVVGWNFTVAAHIFRHALGIAPWSGFLVAFIYMLISYTVAAFFVGPGA